MRSTGVFLLAVAVLFFLGGCTGGDLHGRVVIRNYQVPSSCELAAADYLCDGGAEVRSDTPQAEVTWLAMAGVLAERSAAAGRDARADKAGLSYVPYAQRRGRAYPGEFWRSFGRDGKEFLGIVWDDTKATATNTFSLVSLALAGAAGLALADTANDRVEEHYTKHGSQLNTFWDCVGDVGGAPQLHFGIAGGMYILSHFTGDVKTYEVSKTMLSALSITGLTTVGLKAIFLTESPNGDEFGWPSGHTSSSFCFATVMYHEYGPWVGIPMLAFAGYVGYERIDARNHDFSDVISGALIGVAIGHAVAANHEAKVFGMDVVPYADPQRGAFGVALAKRW